MPVSFGVSSIIAPGSSSVKMRILMIEYEFTLRFKLADPQADPESYVESLYSQGCDDALIGIGRNGRIALDFIREADSALSAVLSAIADIRKTIPEAKLIEASPDFVGISDVAQILGCTRQNMRLIIERSIDVPLAIHEGNSSLWHLSDLLTWLQNAKSYVIDPALLEIAQTTKLINSIRSFGELQKIDELQHAALLEMVA
jgi:hypothetical protein